MYTNLPKIAKIPLYIGAGVLVLWLSMRWVLPWLAPLLLAFAVAALLEPVVSYLCRRLRFPRALASGLCVLVFLGLAFWGLYALCARLIVEIKSFIQRLPELLDSVSATLSTWEISLGKYFSSASGSPALWGDKASEALMSQLESLPERLSSEVLGFLSSVASGTPGALLFSVTLVIGIYFVSASFPSLVRFVKRQIPPRFQSRAKGIRSQLRQTIGRWFKAQLIMMLITFFELALAFWLLGIDYALLIALVTSVIDALPVLGAGTVLIPWGLFELLSGNIPTAAGLLITYAAVTVLRNCIQAKLLGDQLGLHPLATLLSIYVGYKVWGIMGMIVFPILAISLKQLNDSGMIHLWKTEDEEENANGDTVQCDSRNGNERAGRNEYPPW